MKSISTTADDIYSFFSLLKLDIAILFAIIKVDSIATRRLFFEAAVFPAIAFILKILASAVKSQWQLASSLFRPRRVTLVSRRGLFLPITQNSILTYHPMWTIQSTTAHLQIANLTAKIDLAFPNRGLSDVNLNSINLPLAHTLAMQLRKPPSGEPERKLTAYTRERDLIATYGKQANQENHAEIMWRYMTSPNDTQSTVGVEVVATLQTDELYQPAILTSQTALTADNISTYSPEGTWLNSEADAPTANAIAILCHFSNGASYLEIAHPMDAQGFTLNCSGESTRWEFLLLDQEIEKGVIRRARIQGWWCSEFLTRGAASELIANLSNSPLPLTT